jgi:hypothetical protein
MFKRFILRYGFDAFIGIVSLIAVVILSVVGIENLAVILRKIAVFGIWSTVMYISRITKVGIVNWDEKPEWKIYYIYTYLVGSALVFSIS